MCGLVYARALKPNQNVSKEVLKAFIKQRSRGTDGFGLYDGQYKHLIKSPKEQKVRKFLLHHPSTEVLFHHRMPTSCPNVKSACHPFSTGKFFGDTEYILIHNGWINNDDAMANHHYDRGINYTSLQLDDKFNDSESLLWDFALWRQGKIPKMESVGNIAFICIEKKNGENNKLYYYRNTSKPLMIRSNKNFFMLSSEAPVDSKATLIQADRLMTYDYHQGSTTSETLELPMIEKRSYTPETSDEELEERWQHSIQDLNIEEEAIEAKKMALMDDQKQFSADLKSKVTEWLAYCNGYYELAVNMMREEADKEQTNLDVDPSDVEAWYNIRLLEGGVAILLADPFWSNGNTEAVHPSFKSEDTTDAVSHDDPEGGDEDKTDSTVEDKTPSAPEVKQTSLILTYPTHSRSDEHTHGRVGSALIGEVIRERKFGVHKVTDTPGLLNQIPKFSDVETA